MLKVLPKGYKCTICVLANSRMLGIFGCSKHIHEHYKPAAHDPDTCTRVTHRLPSLMFKCHLG